MPKVFISYSRANLDQVLELEQSLLAHGVEVWRDQHSIRGGEQWPKAIGEALAACDAVLLAWSANSANTAAVEFEWNTALALGKKIIPWMLDETPLPASLKTFNWVKGLDSANTVIKILQSLPNVVFNQQLALNGMLMTDEKVPVQATHIGVAGFQVTTDAKGQFKLVLPNSFGEGERVIIKVVKPDWHVNHPVDGEWNLPNLRLQNLQPLAVIIVPCGSKKLWTHARIEKYVAKLSDEITKLKKEGSTPRPVDFSFYLSQWADQFGFSPEQVKAAFDEWAKAIEHSEDFRQLGLRAFYEKNFAAAAANFDRAAHKGEEQIKQIDNQRENKILETYEDWKQAGNSYDNLYQFREALDRYFKAQKLITRDKYPEQWGEILNLIGTAMAQLGERDEAKESQKWLREAITSFHASLDVRTREKMPDKWAGTQSNLGAAFMLLGMRSEGNESVQLLTEAITAFRQVLTVFSSEKLSLDWAMTQNNLGVALWAQGVRTTGPEGTRMLDEAVVTFRSTLRVYTREQWPQDWASALNNLGLAVKAQGEHISGAEGERLLSEAVTSFRAALTVYSREQFPQNWAATQNNLSTALRAQSERATWAEAKVLLAEAVNSLCSVLTFYSREQSPQNWAATHSNMGAALRAQGYRTEGLEGESLLAEAAASFRMALTAYTREQLPQHWAGTQNELGVTLLRLGERTSDVVAASLFSEAARCFSAALTVYSQEQLPLGWAETQNNLGIALQRQGEYADGEDSARLLAEAAIAYRATLSVYSREQQPLMWATTQNNLGVVLRAQSEKATGETRQQLLKEAIFALQQALEVRDRRYHPMDWVQTQRNLADAYWFLKDSQNAAECYANVLGLFPNFEEGFHRATNLYHETLFKFSAAFELRRLWLEAHPDDLAVAADFAENHFTTSRFVECRERITTLLAQPELNDETKIALRLIEVADLLALGQAAQMPTKLDLLSQAVAAQPADFKITWTFNGTLHFIGQEEKLAPYREWLKLLFGAAAAENRDAILKGLREAKAGFKQ